jgi:hypothetical protein
VNAPENSTYDATSRAGHATGEAALQVLEIVLLRLIDRQIIAADDLVAEIESLAEAMPEHGWRPAAWTVKGRLTVLANTLSARAKNDA